AISSDPKQATARINFITPIVSAFCGCCACAVISREMTKSAYVARLILLGLILVSNAFFAGAEVALLSVRDSRLRRLADEGHSGAKIALALLAQPEKLLSVTQIGVTL